jgi:Ca-activated chloride channel homolog
MPLLALAVAGAVALSPNAARADHAVDANVVTALDASDSMMRHEEWIEFDGMARAVSDTAFLDAIRAGVHHRIGFAAFTWSSHGDLRVVVPWTVLGSPVDAAGLPDRLTDLSAAIRFGLHLLEAAPHRARWLVLNVSGNGTDNSGEGPRAARTEALRAGATVNGLVIGEAHGVADYYRRHVIGGPGSFLIQARQPADVAGAMLKKLFLDFLAEDAGDFQLAWGGGAAAVLSLARR